MNAKTIQFYGLLDGKRILKGRKRAAFAGARAKAA
jgi:hypothetical protein